MKLFLKKCRVEMITFLVLLLIASLAIFLSKDALINLVSYGLGIFFILTGILIFVTTIRNRANEESHLAFLFLQGLVVLGLGIAVIVFKSYWIRLLIGGIVLLIPIVKTINANDKKMQIIKEIPKVIAGLILVLSFNQVIKILFLVIGIVLFILSIVLLVFTIKSYRQNKHNSLFYSFFVKTIYRL